MNLQEKLMEQILLVISKAKITPDTTANYRIELEDDVLEPVLALFSELIKGVIGEDEYEDGMVGDDKLMTKYVDRLRATQRTQLTNLLRKD